LRPRRERRRPDRTRPGFTALLDRIEGNGVRTVVVEDASRFARDLVTQELGVLALIGRGVRVLTVSGDDLTNTDDPFAMRQIAGAFAQKRRSGSQAATGVKVEGRKRYAGINPDLVRLAKRLRRYPVNAASVGRCAMSRLRPGRLRRQLGQAVERQQSLV
jgi:DNA invertase Pin-like site-specific DNA recombinase